MAAALPIYSVSQLCREVRILLEQQLFEVLIEGEISNLAQPASGHRYFTLKDQQAQVSCAWFRPRQRNFDFPLQNGMQVLLRAKVSLYEQRGQFQLIVEHLEPAGDGALRRAFEALKQKLSSEGLFDAGRKLPIPSLPRQIGVITSPSGAAIRDFLTVLKRRFPGIPVLIYPVAVQGEAAKREIVRAIELADHRQDCDVLVLTRGGGSLEDLQAFNEEIVARAIAACSIPIVNAVGHEIDFTIADFVADQRAPTPSAAAELISPDRIVLQQQIHRLDEALNRTLRRKLNQAQQTLDWLLRRFQRTSPVERLRLQQQQLLHQRTQLQRAMTRVLQTLQTESRITQQRLHRQNPALRLAEWHQRLAPVKQRLQRLMAMRMTQHKTTLGHLSQQLQTVSPLATLARGYSITESLESPRVLLHADQVQTGDRIRTRLAQGQLISRVESIE